MDKLGYIVGRLMKLVIVPWKMLFAYLFPVRYARMIGVKILGQVYIYGNSYYTFGAEPFLVTLGDNVHISSNVKFICHDGSVLPHKKVDPTLDIVAPIHVGSNVFIGSGAYILPGVTIADNVIVGACSVVTKDVRLGSVIAGNPAREIKTTEDYLEESRLRSLGYGGYSRVEREKLYKKLFQSEKDGKC